MSDPTQAHLLADFNSADLASQAATTNGGTRATTVNPNALQRAPVIQQAVRNFGSSSLDSLPSRADIAMALLQGKNGSNGQVKECNKCKHVYPIEHYQFRDTFNRMKERVNCQTCRIKRRASDKARIRREREAQKQEQQRQGKTSRQLSNDNISSIANPTHAALAGQPNLPAGSTPQRPVSIATRGPLPVVRGKPVVYSRRPTPAHGSSQGHRTILATTRRASAPAVAPKYVYKRAPTLQGQVRIPTVGPMMAQDPPMGLRQVSQPAGFMGLSGAAPGIQTSMGRAGTGSITAPASSVVNTVVWSFSAQPSGLPTTAQASPSSSLLAPSEYSSVGTVGSPDFDAGRITSLGSSDEMGMEWLQKTRADHPEYPITLKSSSPFDGSELNERQFHQVAQTDVGRRSNHHIHLVHQKVQDARKLQEAKETVYPAQEEDEQPVDDDDDNTQDSENEDSSHSLPIPSPTQLASLTPLQKQTRERWELGLKQCMHLRAMDARTLECLWQEREAAAQAGVEICPHTTETPEELWQIPIDTTLVYPESHVCIAQSFPSGDLGSGEVALQGTM